MWRITSPRLHYADMRVELAQVRRRMFEGPAQIEGFRLVFREHRTDIKDLVIERLLLIQRGRHPLEHQICHRRCMAVANRVMLIGWVKHEGARSDAFYPRSCVGDIFAEHDVRLAVENNENFLLDVRVRWMR